MKGGAVVCFNCDRQWESTNSETCPFCERDRLNRIIKAWEEGRVCRCGDADVGLDGHGQLTPTEAYAALEVDDG